VGCPTGTCYPGKKPCDCCGEARSKCGRLFCGIYECICCPDPCYEPRWVPLANAALFVDPARPATQIRLRGGFGWDLRLPGKGQGFWAQEKGRGPQLPCTFPTPTPLPNPCGGAAAFTGPGEPRLDYREGFLYMEGAVERFGLFVELSYRNTSPTVFD